MQKTNDKISESKISALNLSLVAARPDLENDVCAQERAFIDMIDRHFEDRIYISLGEFSMLVEVSTKTLERHIALGNIEFSQTGLGRKKIRRVFTARNVLQFCLRAAGLEARTRAKRGRGRVRGPRGPMMARTPTKASEQAAKARDPPPT